MNIIQIVLSLLGLTGGNTATRTTGAIGGLGTLAAIGGVVVWLFGPGREWQITFNALELSGVCLGFSVLLEWARRAPPPGA